MSKQKPIRVSVFIPAELDAKVAKLADANGISKSAMYAKAVEASLKEMKTKKAA